MSNIYHLVNPMIKGDNFESSITAKNSVEAANKIYKNVSKHFNHNVMKFNFSLQKGGGKFYHFQVSENRKNDEVKYNLQSFTLQNEDDATDRFKQKLNEFNKKFENSQEAGKHSSKSKKHKKKSKKDDSSESSSSDSSLYDSLTENIYRRAKRTVPVSQPFYYWWYDPYLYSLDNVFIPTFYPYVTPYIELSLRYP